MSNLSRLNQALALARNGRHQEALSIYSDLIDRDKSLRKSVLGHRAWLYRAMCRYEEALSDYDLLLAEDPEQTEPMARRAETLLLLGRVQDAARAAVDVLNRDPMDRLSIQVILDCQRTSGTEPNIKLEFPFGKYPDRPLNPVIDMLETDGNSFPVSVFPGLGRILYTIVRCCRPQVAIEIGTNIGYSGLCIAQGMADNGVGHLYSFDLFENTPNQLTNVRKHFEEAGLAKWASFHQGDSSSTIERTLDPELQVDLAFIDGDHTLKGCLKDWYAVDRHIRGGGIILVHDTEPSHCEWLGPRYLLEKLAEQASNDYHAINLPTADGCGIGLIQKNGNGRSPRWMPSLRELIAQRLYHQLIDGRRKTR